MNPKWQPNLFHNMSKNKEKEKKNPRKRRADEQEENNALGRRDIDSPNVEAEESHQTLEEHKTVPLHYAGNHSRQYRYRTSGYHYDYYNSRPHATWGHGYHRQQQWTTPTNRPVHHHHHIDSHQPSEWRHPSHYNTNRSYAPDRLSFWPPSHHKSYTPDSDRSKSEKYQYPLSPNLQLLKEGEASESTDQTAKNQYLLSPNLQRLKEGEASVSTTQILKVSTDQSIFKKDIKGHESPNRPRNMSQDVKPENSEQNHEHEQGESLIDGIERKGSILELIPTSPIQSIQDIVHSKSNPMMKVIQKSDSMMSSGSISDISESKRMRKNAQSRYRAAKYREHIAMIKSKSEQLRTPEEVRTLEDFEDRRNKKNLRSKQRAIEKKERVDNILMKPPNLRTDSEKEFLEVTLRAKYKKNEADRIRRRKIKMKESLEDF